MDKKEIEKELAMREMARRSFHFFLKYVFIWFDDSAYQGSVDNKLHWKIITKLMWVERWDIKRLSINCPPRLWKSIITSQYFAARLLWRSPDKKIIQASYWSDLSNDFGRKTKQITQSQEFKNIFPDFELAKDKREWGNWETSKWWGYYSVWVWWATTGKWADLLIIDDPVKDRIEADSPTTQQRNIEWYDSVASTRLQSQDSAIIVIMTRWNINDLWWYIEREEDWWDKVTIKWIDDQWNEIIRPWKRDEWYMRSIKEKMIPKNWEALYQQDPIAATDWIFRREYFDYFLLSDFEREDWILKKQDLNIWLIIDPAFSSSSSSDDAVIIALWEHQISKHKYLIDWYADTSAPSRTIAWVISMYNRLVMDWFSVKFISVESVTINKDQTKFVDDLKRSLVENGINCPLHIYEPKTKKEDRIKFNLEAPMSQRALKINRNITDKTFVPKLESQFLDFPNWKHDDIVDDISQWFEVFTKRRNIWTVAPVVSPWNKSFISVGELEEDINARYAHLYK